MSSTQTTEQRIARCKPCELNVNDECTHPQEVYWTRGAERACHGIRPWVWFIEICPKGANENE